MKLPITHEEKELLRAITLYPSIAALARVRNQTPSTIQRKVKDLRDKLGAQNKAHLVSMAKEIA